MGLLRFRGKLSVSDSEAPLTGQVNIRMSKGDTKILKHLMDKEGWTKSAAARYIIRLYGKYLSSSRARVTDFEEITEMNGELKLPEKCKCGSDLMIRAGLNANTENTYDEVWECGKCHTLYRAVYKPTSFTELREG